MKAGDEIKYILTLLPKLRPFSELDIQGECNRIDELFTEKMAENLCEYFCQRALTVNMDFGYIFGGYFPKGYDMKGIVTRLKATIDVSKNYRNFSGISDDMDGQVKFIYRTEEIKTK